ncbi:MAG TPA: hypothetical protein VF852_13415, partial [Pseudolabrys sp.]
QLTNTFASRSLIHLYGLPTNTALWSFLQKSPYLDREFFVYLPHGPRPCHTAELPNQFDEYLTRLRLRPTSFI